MIPVPSTPDIAKITSSGGIHCGAALNYPSAPATHHTIERLLDWVEKGERLTDVLGTNPLDRSRRTRKLCPLPSTASFLGACVNDWTLYECACGLV
ncbi:hypothetical protein K432DRAFT_66383 [Lepidopterella palustris CBS 459.81]|uniref:Carboxylic ester hydrolase n=1 Tax=Lepidopterella palustris CBS 459.81 TaxID=1314670 RepID=A0A8E2ELN7_9PEZI|nr:hypothetical protein K432DRAFT_66383 [Lepidopterella palustris CBS 459.81]